MGGYLTVVDGAELKCNGGEGSSYLNATGASKVLLENKKVATIKDHKPGKNVPPFKKCNLRKDKKCKPELPGPWRDNIFSGLLIGASVSQDLSINDILHCSIGGVISIENSGQSTMLTDGPDPSCLPDMSNRPHASALDPEQQARSEEYEARVRQFFGFPDPEEEDHEDALRRLNAMKSKAERALRILVEAGKIATDHAENVEKARRKAEEYRRRVAEKRTEIDEINEEIEWQQREQQRSETWRNNGWRRGRGRFRGGEGEGEVLP
jgi:Domain of unknown function (DUF4280)